MQTPRHSKGLKPDNRLIEIMMITVTNLAPQTYSAQFGTLGFCIFSSLKEVDKRVVLVSSVGDAVFAVSQPHAATLVQSFFKAGGKL
jgi:ABC-type proline/glycine betaine transport system permease subunit